MNPLLLVGASSAARYIASSVSARLSPSDNARMASQAGGKAKVGSDFAQMLQVAQQYSGGGHPTGLQRMEQSLVETAEVKDVVARLGGASGCSVRVSAAGDISVVGAQGEVVVHSSFQTREFAKQVYSASASVRGTEGTASSGEAVVRIPVSASGVVMLASTGGVSERFLGKPSLT